VAVCFLLHFLAGYPEWVLPTIMLFGARTFLDIAAAIVWPTHPLRTIQQVERATKGSMVV